MYLKRCACALLKVKYDMQLVAIITSSLTSDFKGTMINYEHITSIFHSPILPACSISRAEERHQKQLGRCGKSVSRQLHRKSHPSTRWGVTSSISIFPILISDFFRVCSFEILLCSCIFAPSQSAKKRCHKMPGPAQFPWFQHFILFYVVLNL